jgi:hypothetical protein
MPILASVNAKLALEEAIRISDASASSQPPAIAVPLMAAITGFEKP